MILTDEFIEWYEKQNHETQLSTHNFVISTMCSMSLKDRISFVVEILLGEKFNKWISRNQEESEGVIIMDERKCPDCGGIPDELYCEQCGNYFCDDRSDESGCMDAVCESCGCGK